MIKMIKLLIFLLFLGLHSSYGEKYLGKEDFKLKLDLKLQELAHANQANKSVINPEIFERYGTSIQTFHQKVKKYAASLMENRNFPSIQQDSIVSQNVESIYQDILRSSIFSPEGNRIVKATFLDQDNDKTDKMVKYVVLRLTQFLKRGIEIEKINPSPAQKADILEQYDELEQLIQSLALEKLQVPEDLIHKAVEINFKRYEAGPDSVMQMWAKRPFSEDVFSNLKSEIVSKANSMNIDQSANEKIADDWPESLKHRRKAENDFQNALDFINRLNQIIVREYRKILDDEGIVENMKDKVSEPDELIQLREWYKDLSNNLDNWRYLK